ncbi:MAG: succinate dehydrogenase cytochrome b558 subunit [Bacillaceae bacterium]|nr:succinate dehydrogenase cytochrome b558 subunit [Bacillaceae bacterium]
MASSHYFNRKLHSLLGVIPVGFFLIEHLITNYFATRGPEAFNEKVEWIESLPFLPFLEIFFIFLPLLYHAVYGLHIAFTAKHNVGNYGYFRNVMFMLQRVTGVITLIYVAWHVWETRLQKLLYGTKVNFDMMAEILDNPFMVAFYAIGIVAAVFHFSNGMWSFLVSWGITIGPRAQRISTYVWMVVFVIVSTIGLMALYAFANPSMAGQL